MRYTPSTTFDTFPFPEPDPRTVIPELEDIGQRLYDTRAAYMLQNQVGLTITYNRMKDPTCEDPPIEHLRKLHEDMDRAVLTAYGWEDVEVPPFCSRNRAEEKALSAFQDEVIDRLFVLNAARADEERKHGLSGKVAKQKRTNPKPKAKPAKSKNQGDLGFG